MAQAEDGIFHIVQKTFCTNMRWVLQTHCCSGFDEYKDTLLLIMASLLEEASIENKSLPTECDILILKLIGFEIVQLF